MFFSPGIHSASPNWWKREGVAWSGTVFFFMLKRTPTLNSPPFWMGRIKTWSGRSWNGWFSFFDSLCRSRFFLFPRLYRELCCCTAQPPEVRLEKEQKSKRREREPRGSGTELIRQGQHQEFVITPQWSRESRLFRFQSWTIGCEEDLPTDVCFQFQPERPAKKTVTPISPEG